MRMNSSKPGFLSRLRRGTREAVAARIAATSAVDEVRELRSILESRLGQVEQHIVGSTGTHAGNLQEQISQLELKTSMMLRAIYDDEPQSRRRLHALRRTDEYELAYSSPDPLVSILIPTLCRPDLLIDRSVASILAQTHTNLEIIIVGDGATPETVSAVESIEDSRIRFYNRTLNGPQVLDSYGQWLSSGSIPVNEALSMARGQWIVPFADDDAMRPDHLELNLLAARANRWEVCYGKWANHRSDGSIEIDGEFPPKHLHFAWQSGMYHAGLSFMNVEANSALFGEPNDFSLIRRMLAIGVRVGAIENIVADYFPSYRGEFDQS